MALLFRFFDSKENKVVEKFLYLSEIIEADHHTLFEVILDLFEQFDIP